MLSIIVDFHNSKPLSYLPAFILILLVDFIHISKGFRYQLKIYIDTQEKKLMVHVHVQLVITLKFIDQT